MIQTFSNIVQCAFFVFWRELQSAETCVSSSFEQIAGHGNDKSFANDDDRESAVIIRYANDGLSKSLSIMGWNSNNKPKR